MKARPFFDNWARRFPGFLRDWEGFTPPKDVWWSLSDWLEHRLFSPSAEKRAQWSEAEPCFSGLSPPPQNAISFFLAIYERRSVGSGPTFFAKRLKCPSFLFA